MEVLAIIPARGGSKGLPNKNILDLCGKPLIGWTIEAAKVAHQITRVCVSTDDTSIANIGKRFGAEVIARPSAISGDAAKSEDALTHVLDTLFETEKYRPDIIVFLQCTSPLTTGEDIDGTIEKFLAEQADSALAVAPFHYFLWNESSAGQAEGINHDKSQRLLRQERTPEYIETGAVYVMKTAGFLKSKHRFFGKTVLHEIPAERRWEIDEPVDFEIAKRLITKHRGESTTELSAKDVKAIVFDFDGVFTDNSVTLDETGTESVTCSRSDGMGISMLRKLGLPMLVLSGEENLVGANRCKKLKLEYKFNIDNKLPVLIEWIEQTGVDVANVLYLGNDFNDLECLKHVGIGVVVSDAHPSAVDAAQHRLTNPGGKGAIRELADLLVNDSSRSG